MSYAFWSNFTYTAYLIFFWYFIILVIYYFFIGITGLVERIIWEKKRESEDYSLFYFSTFDMPVSIIMPVRNEEVWVRDSVKSVLNLNYPKFELIVVDDGSTDNSFGILDDVLELKPTDMFYARHYRDGKTYDILKSVKYPNVTVVRKQPGLKKAGAVNAGLNIAGYDYICVIDADTVAEQDCLLKVMAQIQKDPEKIVGAGSYFGLSNGLKIKEGVIMKRRFSYQPILAYQNLEYIRSFFGIRMGLGRFNAMPNVAGGFGVWRRDVMYELGGYSSDFSSEDIEFTFRVHKHLAENKKRDNRIMMLPYYVAWTQGPSSIRSLLKQRDRWQRVVIETVWQYKTMLFNPKYGSFGFLAFPYHLLYEVLGVFFEIASIVFIAAGWLFNVLDTNTFFAYIAFMLLCQAILSLVSLFSFMGAQKVFSKRYTVYLVLLSLVEFISYRWLVSIAKVSGTLNYLRGVRVYDTYAREKRGAAAVNLKQNMSAGKDI